MRAATLQTGRAAVSAANSKWCLGAYLAMIASWVFDFQAESAAAAVQTQSLFLGSFLFFFVLFVGLDRSLKPIPGLVLLLTTTVNFILFGSIRGLLNNQPLYEVFKTALPSLMYLIMAYATARIVEKAHARTLRVALAGFCLCFAFSTVAMLMASGQSNLLAVRFRILSGATLPMLGYVDCLLLFGLVVTEYTALFLAIILLFLSITRTYVLAVIAMVAPLTTSLRQLVGSRMFFGILGVGAFLVGTVMLGGEGGDRWNERFYKEQTAGGESYTMYTRRSEWTYMWDAFGSSTGHVLFGNGMAAQTVWHNPKEMGGGTEGSVGFGHNQHISLLFIAGILGGLPLLLVQTLQVAQSADLLRKLPKWRGRGDDLFFLAAWGATIIIGNFTSNFLSSTFGSRSWALWYGIGTGLFLGARACIIASRPAAAARGAGARMPGAVPGGRMLPPAVLRRRAALAKSSMAK